MKRALALILTALFLFPINLPVQAADKWEMTADSLTLGMNGVSPHVERFNGVDRVWRSDGPTGTVASDCTDAGVCTNVPITGRLGNDFTVVTFPNGTKRAYFKEMEPGFQQVYSAPCNDAGCTSIGTRTATSSEMRVPSTAKAWGVPDPVLLPDGRVRIYIVESPVFGKCLEKIATYISTDGITFTKEPGWRFEGGYVDTEILRAKNGDWVMIMADIGCTTSNRQELFVSTSKDGLDWSKPQILSGPGLGGLDPTGYEVKPNEFRIYFAQEARMGSQDFTIKRGTLKLVPEPVVVATPTPTPTPTPVVTVTPTPTPTPTPSPAVTESASPMATPTLIAQAPVTKKTTITCVKGKTIKKVTGKNPKCPKGYKKK